MTKSIFIQWTEQEQVFESWSYVSNGVSDPVFKTRTIKREVRYSNQATDEMIARAKQYIASDMQDRDSAKVVVK